MVAGYNQYIQKSISFPPEATSENYFQLRFTIALKSQNPTKINYKWCRNLYGGISTIERY